MKRIMQACVLLALLFLALLLVGCGTVQAQGLDTVVPCSTDADCHARNPGLCAEDEPYCLKAPHVHTTGEGMSPLMAALMFGAQAGDLISTEVNHAHGLGESNVLMKYRAVRYPIKVLGPLATYFSARHLPRSKANRKAWGWTITGFGMTGVNITLLKVWGK